MLPILLFNLADLAQVYTFAGQSLSSWSTEEHQIHGKDKFIAVIFHRFSFKHIPPWFGGDQRSLSRRLVREKISRVLMFLTF